MFVADDHTHTKKTNKKTDQQSRSEEKRDGLKGEDACVLRGQ